MASYLPYTRELATATPPERNRVVDFWRAAAICVVVIGHWLAASIWLQPDGEIALLNSLEWVPYAGWITWIVQVMPVFFIAGGYANARGLGKVERGEAAAARLDHIESSATVHSGDSAPRRVGRADSGVAPIRGQRGRVRRCDVGDCSALVPRGLHLADGPGAVLPCLVEPIRPRQRRHPGRGCSSGRRAPLRRRSPRDRLGQLPLSSGLRSTSSGTGGPGATGGGRLSRQSEGWLILGGALGALIVVTWIGWYPVAMVGVPGAGRHEHDTADRRDVSAGLGTGRRDLGDAAQGGQSDGQHQVVASGGCRLRSNHDAVSVAPHGVVAHGRPVSQHLRRSSLQDGARHVAVVDHPARLAAGTRRRHGRACCHLRPLRVAACLRRLRRTLGGGSLSVCSSLRAPLLRSPTSASSHRTPSSTGAFPSPPSLVRGCWALCLRSMVATASVTIVERRPAERTISPSSPVGQPQTASPPCSSIPLVATAAVIRPQSGGRSTLLGSAALR